MATVVAEKMEACTDCVLLIANGEVTDQHGNDIAEELAERIADHLGTEFAMCTLVVESSEDGDGWFSWSPCEICGSELGGDRHHVSALTN